MSAFKSVFAQHLDGYVALQCALGLSFETQAYLLRKFDDFVVRSTHQGRLTQRLAMDFANTASARSMPARRYEVVRNFSVYLATVVPGSPTLDRRAMRRDEPRRPARIFSDAELAHLVHGARTSPPRSAIRGHALATMIGLGASCGLRPAEVVSLDRGDIDWTKGVLEIRRTKFKKDRLVPLHSSCLQALREYAAERDAIFPDLGYEAFFLNARGARFASAAFEAAFRDLIRGLGMREPRGRGPTFGDLRHTFAVRRLVAWYREGADVQAKLPVLATFMGHVDYSYTAYYIAATPELQGLAESRLQRWLSGEEVAR